MTSTTQTRLQRITTESFGALINRARHSERRRTNFNFHASLDDNPHRFLNVMLEGTYVRPHRHIDPPKCESFVLLQGQVGFFTFDDGGHVNDIHIAGQGPLGPSPNSLLGIDIAPGVWHTLVVTTPDAVCFEVKPGPYSTVSDKEFASWAPAEDTAEAAEYEQTLQRMLRTAA